MRILVIGAGYVGVVTAVCLASKGEQVICYDVDKQKIDMLKEGKPPIYEQGLEELMKESRENIIYTTNKNIAYSKADIIFVCVGTPESKDGSANLSYIYKVADDIVENITKDCLIVMKSTVPVGSNYEIENYIKNKLKGKYKIEVASNPEFLAQGTAIRDTLNAERIVIGTHSEWAKQILEKVYSNFKSSKLVFTDINSAEMIKYASNNFLALKISFINEIANLCELVNADIQKVEEGMGLDSRIGNQFLKAGIGYGGSCFPKDTKALYHLAKTKNYELKTIKASIEINEKQKLKLIEKLKKYYDDIQDLNVAILGLTFKPNTDDLREASSIPNIEYLIQNGTNIKVWDPLAKNKVIEKFKTIKYCSTIDETIENTDICFIFTEWEEIKKYNVKQYEKLMKTPIILDGRNCYELEQFKNTSITYDSIGRSTINPKENLERRD